MKATEDFWNKMLAWVDGQALKQNKQGHTTTMTHDEIIDIASAHKAGMRIQSCRYGDNRWHDHLFCWNFQSYHHRVHPEDAKRWEEIKEQRKRREIVVTNESDLPITIDCDGTKWRIQEAYRQTPGYETISLPEKPEPDLPPVPEGAVLLPVEFRLPEDMEQLEIWCSIPGRRQWDWGSCWGWFGGDPGIRYAVRPDTEIARINGVGFGPCPSPHGWHNPGGWTPQQIEVPERRLLCRDEVGTRLGEVGSIERLIESVSEWHNMSYGRSKNITYRTALPYGQLPPVKKHTFPECAPERKPEYEYGRKANGEEVVIPPEYADDWEIVPEGERLPEDYWVPYYSRERDRWFGFSGVGAGVGLRFGNGELARLFILRKASDCACARKKYSVLHRESGIKTGDTVRVTRAAENYERGWAEAWVNRMNKYVGKQYAITGDLEGDGFELDDMPFGFPAFVLEKIEPHRVPLDATDWGGGPWVIRAKGTLFEQLVTAIGHASKTVMSSNGCAYGYNRLMMDYERARGWPGDADLTWKPCWKWQNEEP